ncbi:MAG: Ryanodine receptor Ryr [Oscillospiraceae bacterium]|nr:Ryanodine receptor Ryr [Oscillospiraceae bacterium]
MYQPKNFNENELQLPEELLPLREILAEDIHDAWAAGRLAEGWQYGPVRDDLRRTHPDLVPYGDLPEGEKEYDRRTAAATIRCILAHGYRIEKAKREQAGSQVNDGIYKQG